jgi:hypothetical protein
MEKFFITTTMKARKVRTNVKRMPIAFSDINTIIHHELA